VISSWLIAIRGRGERPRFFCLLVVNFIVISVPLFFLAPSTPQGTVGDGFVMQLRSQRP
jgi:hypothetical protein